MLTKSFSDQDCPVHLILQWHKFQRIFLLQFYPAGHQVVKESSSPQISLQEICIDSNSHIFFTILLKSDCSSFIRIAENHSRSKRQVTFTIQAGLLKMYSPVVLEFRIEFQEILEGRKRSQLNFMNYLRLVFCKDLYVRKQKNSNKQKLVRCYQKSTKICLQRNLNNTKLSLEESQFPLQC